MPLLKKSYTSKDYWNLPDGQRAELIDGQFYNMAPLSRIHQEISYQISRLSGKLYRVQRRKMPRLSGSFRRQSGCR